MKAIVRLDECLPFTAGDGTLLREILHPAKLPVAARYSLAHAALPPGQWSALHHLKSCEVYFILKGRGTMEINGQPSDVGPGDTVYIEPLGRQRILSKGPEVLEFLCIVDPAWQESDEIIDPPQGEGTK